MKTQKVVDGTSSWYFFQTLNKNWLDQGWQVVPGTMIIHKHTYTDEQGRVKTNEVYAVVIELPEDIDFDDEAT